MTSDPWNLVYVAMLVVLVLFWVWYGVRGRKADREWDAWRARQLELLRRAYEEEGRDDDRDR